MFWGAKKISKFFWKYFSNRIEKLHKMAFIIFFFFLEKVWKSWKNLLQNFPDDVLHLLYSGTTRVMECSFVPQNSINSWQQTPICQFILFSQFIWSCQFLLFIFSLWIYSKSMRRSFMSFSDLLWCPRKFAMESCENNCPKNCKALRDRGASSFLHNGMVSFL